MQDSTVIIREASSEDIERARQQVQKHEKIKTDKVPKLQSSTSSMSYDTVFMFIHFFVKCKYFFMFVWYCKQTTMIIFALEKANNFRAKEHNIIMKRNPSFIIRKQTYHRLYNVSIMSNVLHTLISLLIHNEQRNLQMHTLISFLIHNEQRNLPHKFKPMLLHYLEKCCAEVKTKNIKKIWWFTT